MLKLNALGFPILGLFLSFSSVTAHSAAGQTGMTTTPTTPDAIRMKEFHRRVPAMTIPAPSNSELASAPAPKAHFMSLDQAMSFIGLNKAAPNPVARIPGGQIGIVDLGFHGLRKWLAAHPNEAKITKLLSVSAPGSAPSQEPNLSDHGYWVYRVLRAVLPTVPIYAVALADDSEVGVETAVDTLYGHGVRVFNLSVGGASDCSLYRKYGSAVASELRINFVPLQVFAFNAVGNDRQSVNTWTSIDTGRGDFVGFRTAAQAARIPGSSIDAERIVLAPKPNNNAICFGWGTSTHPEARYELELDSPQGKTLASVTSSPKQNIQSIILHFAPSHEMPAIIRIKRLAGPASGIPMRLQVVSYSNSSSGSYSGPMPDFNGLQTAPANNYYDNPFVISVGGFGKSASGKLVPSPFSDIGQKPDGKLIPDVLGPDEFKLGGHELAGTSYAAPLITALFAPYVGYNLKNLVELVSDDNQYDPRVPAFERGQWGIPDPKKIVILNKLVGPTTVSNVSEDIEGRSLVIRYTISRCCMQDMIWATAAILNDKNGKPLLDSAGKPFISLMRLRTERDGRVNYPVTLKFPMASLQPFKGKTIGLAFGILVDLWRNFPPSSYDVHQPDFKFKL